MKVLGIMAHRWGWAGGDGPALEIAGSVTIPWVGHWAASQGAPFEVTRNPVN